MTNDYFFQFSIYWVLGLIIFYTQVYVIKPKTEEEKEEQKYFQDTMEKASSIHITLPIVCVFVCSLISVPSLIISSIKWLNKRFIK